MIPEKLQNAINYAIEKEQEAADFYYDLAGKIKSRSIGDELRRFAAMEEGHRDKLKQLDIEAAAKGTPKEVMDLQISDYMVDLEPTLDMSYQDILIIAMKRELAANKLYTTLANMFSSDKPVNQLFKNLAAEESEHKLYFEKIYDEDILKEN